MQWVFFQPECMNKLAIHQMPQFPGFIVSILCLTHELKIIHKPSHESMAGLLGSAIGVMATVSIVELIVRNALENDTFMVLACALGGALAYYILEPLFPKVDEEQLVKVRAPGMGYDQTWSVQVVE